MQRVEEAAVKHDAEKLRYDLIPTQPLEEYVRNLTLGATKYDDRNWEKGMSWSRAYAALQRHVQAWWQGESRDAEGFHHLAAVTFYAFALMEFERTHPELDDRPVKLTDNADNAYSPAQVSALTEFYGHRAERMMRGTDSAPEELTSC